MIHTLDRNIIASVLNCHFLLLRPEGWTDRLRSLEAMAQVVVPLPRIQQILLKSRGSVAFVFLSSVFGQPVQIIPFDFIILPFQSFTPGTVRVISIHSQLEYTENQDGREERAKRGGWNGCMISQFWLTFLFREVLLAFLSFFSFLFY